MKHIVIDQLNRQLVVPKSPKRIISLVPSQTELLFDLGLEEEIVGITKFCIHPQSKCRTKTKIGGTKKLNLSRIHALQPDLIIGNKEENEKNQILELSNHYPIWMSDIYTLTDALAMIQEIGSLVNRTIEAQEMTQKISKQFSQLIPSKPLKVGYLIWRKPYMAAAHQTFIDHMLKHCGFINIFGHTTRYPVVSIEKMQELQPDLLLLSSEPYPFKQKHIDELAHCLPQTDIRLVDGELFSWYGSRLLKSSIYFQQLINSL